jgi:mycofactocin precursor peptide peptidase
VSSLAAHAWPDLDRREAVLAIPLGATEQHGPHLPLSTDTAIASALAERLAAALSGIVVAPALAYGASGEHQDFTGTVSIGADAMELVLVEMARSATATFRRVLFVSAHGGNAVAVTHAVRRLRSEGRDVRAWSPATVWDGDAHAGYTETSVMLALDPVSVRMDAAQPGDRRPVSELMPLLRRQGVAAVSPSGVLGDPTGASPRAGERLLATAAQALVAGVQDWAARDQDWL